MTQLCKSVPIIVPETAHPAIGNNNKYPHYYTYIFCQKFRLGGGRNSAMFWPNVVTRYRVKTISSLFTNCSGFALELPYDSYLSNTFGFAEIAPVAILLKQVVANRLEMVLR